MQQRVAPQVVCIAQWTELLVEARRTDRQHPLVQQFFAVQVRVHAHAEAHRHVEVLAYEIHQFVRGMQVQIDLGTGDAKALQTRQQPLLQKRGQETDAQRPGGTVAARIIDGALELLERLAHAR